MISKLRKETNVFLKSHFQGKKYKLALNLGCGSDSDKEGSRYSKYFQAEQILLMDPRSNVHSQLSAVALAEALPLRDASVDLVFLHWVLVIGDPVVSIQTENALKEIQRVLMSDGEIVISYADRSSNQDHVVHNTKEQLSRYFSPTKIETFYIPNDIYLDSRVNWKAEIFAGGLR